MILHETRWAKVNNLNLALADRLDENVFGFEVAVHQMQGVDLVQCVQDLECHPLQFAYRELQLIFASWKQLTVDFLQFIQIVFK